MVLRDALGELIWAGEQSRVDSGIEQVEVRRVREGTADPRRLPRPARPEEEEALARRGLEQSGILESFLAEKNDSSSQECSPAPPDAHRETITRRLRNVAPRARPCRRCGIADTSWRSRSSVTMKRIVRRACGHGPIVERDVAARAVHEIGERERIAT